MLEDSHHSPDVSRREAASISAYIVQGFALANRAQHLATMLRLKRFEALWAVIGFFLCLLPLLIDLIIYATQKDQVVELRVDGTVRARCGGCAVVARRPVLVGRYAMAGRESDRPSHTHRSNDGLFW